MVGVLLDYRDPGYCDASECFTVLGRRTPLDTVMLWVLIAGLAYGIAFLVGYRARFAKRDKRRDIANPS